MTKILKSRADFNKYANMASGFSSMVTGVEGTLNGAISEINNINSSLSVGKVSSNDLLTCNVIASCEEVKTEIQTVSSEIGSYTGLVSAKANELDNEEYNQYLWQARQDDDSESA